MDLFMSADNYFNKLESDSLWWRIYSCKKKLKANTLIEIKLICTQIKRLIQSLLEKNIPSANNL